MLGIPTMVVTRSGFSQVVGNAFAGFGFPAEGPSVFEFPMEMFVSGSNLTPINENIDKIVYGLTKWEPKVKAKGVYPAKKVTVTGKDYQEAVANMNLLFLKNLWSDGLPILPATEERVNWILTGTGLPRDTVIDKILPRGGIATVEGLAIALAVVGGRPEHLPVLIAIVKAMVDPLMQQKSWATTTCSNFLMVVVNGPIAKQIRLNSGYSCLGPHPLYPAGAAIGRAIRFLLMTVGGGTPGVASMSLYGAMRYTNAVFAEDEDGIPSGWSSVAVERGFAKDANVVTVSIFKTAQNIHFSDAGTEKSALAMLYGCAEHMRAPDSHSFRTVTPSHVTMALLMGRGTAKGLADAGWSKEKIKGFLWEEARVPYSVMVKVGFEQTAIDRLKELGLPKGAPVPLGQSPKNIQIVVAGGAQSGHTYLFTAYGHQDSISAEIKPPAKAKWDELLKEAEKDLGPIPAG
jgi:hypothetical protein